MNLYGDMTRGSLEKQFRKLPNTSKGQAKALAKKVLWMRANFHMTDRQFFDHIENMMKEVPLTGTLQNNVRHRA